MTRAIRRDVLAGIVIGALAGADATLALAGPPAAMARVGPGALYPLYAPAPGITEIAVAAFLLDRLPVTNGQFLAFVVAHPDGRELMAEGVCEGVIAQTPGGAGGFGYDPVFVYPPLARTFAELTPEEKDQVSHRAQAVEQLRRSLLAFLAQ